MGENFKIINLQAENIKKLVSIDITPNSNVVKITGKNGQGKTSTLDAIWWCLGGAKNIQSKPIRTGTDEAFVTIDLGELKVTRTFKYKKDGEVTSSLKVEGEKGSPQSVIDKLLGDLTFDPLVFMRTESKKQLEILRKFIPNVDFDKMDSDNKKDYGERTLLGRDIKSAQGLVDSISIEVTDLEKIDEQSLLEKMEKASTHNSDIEKRKANRLNLARKERELRAQAECLLTEANDISDKLKSAGELPELIDISKLSDEITFARQNNWKIDEIEKQKVAQLKVDNLTAEYNALTNNINNRNKEKQDAITSANLPIKGLSFDEEGILLNGNPFSQASDAEQLKASLAIAMALNPKLHVIRVRDGSLLDDDSMEVIEEMAIKHDFQIWIERVDSSGKVGFVIEEGSCIKHNTNEPDYELADFDE